MLGCNVARIIVLFSEATCTVGTKKAVVINGGHSAIVGRLSILFAFLIQLRANMAITQVRTVSEGGGSSHVLEE
jgi:5,10-methylene-tetrahydrofolate dehydrogenase/methenyl tetrahydrofolate cyclohydrolase